jgi:hypothetical protein
MSHDYGGPSSELLGLSSAVRFTDYRANARETGTARSIGSPSRRGSCALSLTSKRVMIRIPYQELYDVLLTVSLKAGFETERARLSARLFTDASRDGVYSHGLNRFPRFMEMIRRGVVDIQAQAAPWSAGMAGVVPVT